MGKTKRRKDYGYGKNKRNYDDWIFRDWDIVKGVPSWKWERIQLEGVKRQGAIKHFHSDAGCGDRWPVPAWFRREKERIRRAKMKQETRNILKRVQSGDYDIDDDNYIPARKTIQWDWW